MTWLWEYDDSGGYDIVATIRNMEALDKWAVELSDPLGQGFPVVDIALKSSGLLPDFFPVGPLRIVSARIKDVVERLGGHAEFFPVSIRGPGIFPSIGAYFFMHPLDELPCMDAKQSEFTMDDDYIDRISHFVIDESVARRKPIFRLAKSFVMPLFVSHELADSLRSSNVTGVSLEPPSAFTY